MEFDPKDIVEHLRHNLERYPYGDGFPVFRELLQNADDAGATTVALRLLPGWPAASNPLLKGHGLLLVNDGAFDDRSARGMQTFGGSVKALDETAVGRFGLGQKSVFHLCDAFVVVPDGYGPAHGPIVVNPFEKLGRDGDACRLWARIGDGDAARIKTAGESAVASSPRLNLWFPLRRDGLRPKPKSTGIVASDIAPESLAPWADGWRLAEMLAALRHVRRVTVAIGQARCALDRGEAARMVGYTLAPGARDFGGSLGGRLATLGRERRSSEGFRSDLRQSPNWPRSRNRETDEEKPQKATPHGAAILVIDPEGPPGLAADWSVLLPVAAAFPAQQLKGRGSAKLLLHGCFFVDSGRKAVIGLDPAVGPETGEAWVRAEWNRSLRDKLVLPLVPAVLHDALSQQVLSGEALAEIVRALAASSFGRKHRAALAAEQALARVVAPERRPAFATWRLVPADAPLRPLPAPDERGNVAIAALLPQLADCAAARRLVLVAGPEAALAADTPRWQAQELAEVFAGLQPDLFANAKQTETLADFLDVAAADDDLRKASASPVLGALRAALAGTRPLAPHREITRVLERIDLARTVPLPPTAAERYILRALSAAARAPLCLPREWLPVAAGGSRLDAKEAHALIAALQPELANEGHAEAAGSAALAIIRHTASLDVALRHEGLRSLHVVRALDGRGTLLLSLADLDTAARETRLFRDNPQARGRLARIAAALSGDAAYILPAKAAEALADGGTAASREPWLTLGDLDPAAACDLIRKAATFGPPSGRAALLNDLFDTEKDRRLALRALAAGDRRALDDRCRLLALRETAPALDALIARLIAAAPQEVPVPAGVMDKLDRGKARHLGIEELDGDGLGDLLRRHADQLGRHGLDLATAEAILRANIPEDILRQLPILPLSGGGWAKADQLYRPNPDWSVPAAMTGIVPMLAAFSTRPARERAEALVKPWSPETQITICLDQPDPSRFGAEILSALAKSERTAAEDLRCAKWLLDRMGRAWAPDDVLDLPDDVLAAASQVLGADLPFLPVGDIAPALRDHEVFGTLRDKGMLPDTGGSRDRLLLIVEDRKPVAYMGEPTEKLARALAALARSGAALPLDGWPLLAALLKGGQEVGPPIDPSTSDGQSDEPVSPVLQIFATVDGSAKDDVISWLNALATCASATGGSDDDGRQAGRAAYDEGFRTLSKWPLSSFHSIIGRVPVPTEGGSWRPGAEVSARAFGISRSYRLDAELARYVPEQDQPGHNALPAGLPPAGASPAVRSEQDCEESLIALVNRLGSEVPPKALALLVGILARQDLFERVARDHLAIPQAELGAVTGALEEIARSLVDDREKAVRSHIRLRKRAVLHFSFVRGGSVVIRALDGRFRDAPSNSRKPFEVLGDGHLKIGRLSGYKVPRDAVDHFHEVALADCDGPIEQQTLGALIRTAGPLVEWHFDRYADAVIEEFSKAFNSEQSTVEDASVRIEDRLPQILAELKPPLGSPIRDALDRYERAEQSIAPEKRGSRLPGQKRSLWAEVARPNSAAQLLALIRSGIGRYGYGPARVIFELFQNADDAALQHPTEGPATCGIIWDERQERVRVVHWGRLINHLGADPAEGERKGWQRDLFNMLLMNLSEKREEVTGRFGLGFKSVHLIAREVGIASGFVACRVQGGMLPEVWDDGRELSRKHTRSGRRATVIDLEIDAGRQAEAEVALDAFAAAVRWLPATARAIREVVLKGRRHAARFAETGVQGIRHVAFEGVAPGHALALALDEHTTLFLPLDADGPAALPGDLPRLWLLAPLEEECRAGWLLNSYGFRVDPGRGRLSGRVDERAQLFARFGSALGKRLLELFDMLGKDWAGFATAAGLADTDPERGRALFLDRLVALFADDLARGDKDLRLETHLHRNGGLRHLVSARAALPTGLPAPFQRFLRADQVRWRIAGPLAEPARLARLDGWRGVEDIAASAVGGRTAALLERMGFAAPPVFDAATLVRAEIGADGRVDAGMAAQLGALLDDDLVKALSTAEQDTLFNAAAKAKFRMADGRWCPASLVPRAAADADEEEQLILAFAPDSAVAADEYAGAALAFYRLAARKSGIKRTAATFADWAQEMHDLDERRALLAYVLTGAQGKQLETELLSKRPHWLPEDDAELRKSDLLAKFDDNERGDLISALCPKVRRAVGTGQLRPIEPDVQPEPPPDPAAVLASIRVWWRLHHKSERRAYDNRVWPDGFRPGGLGDCGTAEDRIGWFTFFGLGIFRTLGWNNESAHRSFVEGATRTGWWQEMATARLPEDPSPWLARLEDFARADAWRINFPQWRRTLADLYALARWLPDYAAAFRLLPQVVERNGRVALSDIWRLSHSPVWQRRGLEGAPLTQSLGLGANWMIREAVRHGLWAGDEAALMHPFGWAATERLRDFFSKSLGHPLGNRNSMDLSPEIHAFVERHLGPDADFLGDLDLPLQLWTTGETLLLVAASTDGGAPEFGDVGEETDE